jgi:hypothetical protein
MAKHQDVHVTRDIRRSRWVVLRGGRRLGTYGTQEMACMLGFHIAQRNRVDLVVRGRDGRIRSKDSYGNESPASDTEH